jgi:hypothetical protein
MVADVKSSWSRKSTCRRSGELWRKVTTQLSSLSSLSNLRECTLTSRGLACEQHACGRWQLGMPLNPLSFRGVDMSRDNAEPRTKAMEHRNTLNACIAFSLENNALPHLEYCQWEHIDKMVHVDPALRGLKGGKIGITLEEWNQSHSIPELIFWCQCQHYHNAKFKCTYSVH